VVGGIDPLVAGADELAITESNTRTRASLKHKAWYRPDLDRGDVQVALHNQPEGLFIVRPSKSRPGCYAISIAVKILKGGVWTGRYPPYSSPSATADQTVAG
jgi:hypothetical protein